MNKEGMRENLFKLARGPLKAMPLIVEATAAGLFFSAVVDKYPKFKKRLAELEGKVFLFEATDIGKRFHLVIKGGDIKVIPHVSIAPDVVMRGQVGVLAELFLGRVDPDTVFFTRRLEINGDTAAAVHLKNILAAVF